MCLHICLCVFATIRVNAGADTEDWWKRIFVKQIRSCTQKLYRLFPCTKLSTYDKMCCRCIWICQSVSIHLTQFWNLVISKRHSRLIQQNIVEKLTTDCLTLFSATCSYQNDFQDTTIFVFCNSCKGKHSRLFGLFENICDKTKKM